MSLARKLRRQHRSSGPEPLHVGEFPSARVARDTLRAWVERAHAKPSVLIALVNETNPERVRVTLGTRGYWRYVASHTDAQHDWLEIESDGVVVVMFDGDEMRACELGDLEQEFPLQEST